MAISIIYNYTPDSTQSLLLNKTVILDKSYNIMNESYF